MPHLRKQSQRQGDVGRHPDRPVNHRAARVLAGEKRWLQRAHQNKGRQAEAKITQSGSGCFSVGWRERAAFKKHIYNRVDQHIKAESRRQGQQHSQRNREVLAGARAGMVGARDAARQIGQEGNGKCHADHAHRQLVQAVGIIKPRGGTGLSGRN